ncbi:PREDICTED: uncharacterized protein LOC105449108 [Wasmannia auropunctata]|uniref:uncharacterized protein LOC105449108 n=1 Tax=Wasmannia auropunctata TaxID=64793 RepID=UPI0005EEC871|nr:PREDICTED: uncharacterized protein LOC105449108 [Wasmannia auropunctata]
MTSFLLRQSFQSGSTIPVGRHRFVFAAPEPLQQIERFKLSRNKNITLTANLEQAVNTGRCKFIARHLSPLPEEKPETTSVLCNDRDVADVFRKKPYQVVDELAKVTYTTKHRWYPRSRDKRAKDTKPDRPYL